MTELGFRTVLDVRTAKAAMRDLQTMAQQTHRRGIPGALGWGAQKVRAVSGRVGFAAGAVSAASAVHRVLAARSEGAVNPWVEAIVPEVAAMDQLVLDGLGYSATAASRARAYLKETSAMAVGERGFQVAERNLYRTALRLFTSEERGRLILRQDRRFQGPSLKELITSGAAGYATLVKEAFDYFIGLILRR